MEQIKEERKIIEEEWKIKVIKKGRRGSIKRKGRGEAKNEGYQRKVGRKCVRNKESKK